MVLMREAYAGHPVPWLVNSRAPEEASNRCPRGGAVARGPAVAAPHRGGMFLDASKNSACIDNSGTSYMALVVVWFDTLSYVRCALLEVKLDVAGFRKSNCGVETSICRPMHWSLSILRQVEHLI
jgi:hypothetical protein